MHVLADVDTLYDGTGADARALHHHVDLVIEQGRVRAIEPHDPARRRPEDATVVNASGLTVTPGLVDCHGHVTVLGLGDADMARMNGPEELLFVEKVLHATLVDGCVTTMRDVGGATHRIKRLVDEGVMLGPRLKVAICMLSSTGGHADFRGPDRCHAELSRLWPPAPGRPSSIVDGPWEARKRVREIAACGADLIKVCTSPGVASPTDHLEHRELTEEELRAICDEASARGLKVAAHAHSIGGIDLAIRAGVHDLQHVSFLDEAAVERAYEAGCTVTPTSWVMAELREAQGLAPLVMEKVKRVSEVHARAVAHAAAGGLPILMGTDPVLPGMHGRNYMELAHLIRDGLAPLSAWHAATGLAAREIGQDDAGTLAPGRRADLVVARGDVLEDPALLGRGALVEVVKDGFGHRGGLRDLPQVGFRSTVERWIRGGE